MKAFVLLLSLLVALVAASDMPSQPPTQIPSYVPSNLPSYFPSHAPSDKPSKAPSHPPSLFPSDVPSPAPSHFPSHLPSLSPSDKPSNVPSLRPSRRPSGTPSHAPSDRPSRTPSDKPSRSPSDEPSHSPSDEPSRSPSDEPSYSPSDEPSHSPSDSPSNLPSKFPSNSPSNVPSQQPSDVPSAQPSVDTCKTDATITCSGTDVCDNNACVSNTAVAMLNSIAVFATGQSGVTYDSTTSTTFEDLFSCTSFSHDDRSLLLEQAHHVWQGMVDYVRASNFNAIMIQKNDGNEVTVLDNWGQRCQHQEDPTIFDHCSVGGRWFECSSAETCVPQTLLYTDSLGEQLDIDIYEPCNFVSNLAYYRVMPMVCKDDDDDDSNYFYMNAETSHALNHAFGGLAAGSAMWHGSHTFLGQRADNRMIAVVSFVIHQLILGSIGDAPGVDRSDEDFQKLMYLTNQPPRSRTAIQIANDVTNFITSQPVSEWALEFQRLDLPAHDTIFATIISTIVAIIFHDKPDFVHDVLHQLLTFFNGDEDELDGYLPELLELGAALDLPNDTKFVLFRQFIGMGGKMLFAFLWQEKQIQFEDNIFLQKETNEQAPVLLPLVGSFFNFLTGFKHVDEQFERFNGMYPGCDDCRATQPHAKWHEISASALLDMVYLADCIGSFVSGSNTCAHMSANSLSGKEKMSKNSFRNWVKQELEHLLDEDLLDIPEPLLTILQQDFILTFASDLLGDTIFHLLDRDDEGSSQNQVDWSDIEDITDLVSYGMGFLDTVLGLYHNFCTKNSDCGSGMYCDVLGLKGPPLQCQSKRNNGKTCSGDASCESGTCAFGIDDLNSIPFECGMECSKHSDCNDDEWCHTAFSPRICKPKENKGFFPCLRNRQCNDGKCSWWHECVGDDGNSCNQHSDCNPDEFCENTITDTCFKKLPKNHPCTKNRHCLSNNCGNKVLGIGKCKTNNELEFCKGLDCTVDMLNDYITELCDSCSAQQLQNAIDDGLEFFTNFVDLPFL